MTRALCHHKSHFLVWMHHPRRNYVRLVISESSQMYRKKSRLIWENHGSSCIFVGYSTTHEIDVFRFYNTTTKKICLSRDVTWLDKNMVPGKASGQILLNRRKMTLMTLVNLDGMIKMMKFLKFNQMSNQLLLKKSLLFALHYVNFKRFIMTHQ